VTTRRAAEKMLGRSPEEAARELEAMPEVGEVIVYTRRLEELVSALGSGGVEVVAQFPMVNAVVLRGPRAEILKLLESELVEAFDLPRRVYKLGERV